MNNTILVNDRVLLMDSGLNPLTDFFVIDDLQTKYRCRYEYGIISGFGDFLKEKVKLHPIQSAQFKIQMHIRGKQEIDINEFDKYFSNFNNWSNLITMAIVCFEEIFKNITDPRHFEIAKNIMHDFVQSDNPANDLDYYISEYINSFPIEYNSKATIEYSDINGPIAFFNSEHLNNCNTTIIFLLSFTVIILQLNLVTPDLLLTRTKFIY